MQELERVLICHHIYLILGNILKICKLYWELLTSHLENGVLHLLPTQNNGIHIIAECIV